MLIYRANKALSYGLPYELTKRDVVHVCRFPAIKDAPSVFFMHDDLFLFLRRCSEDDFFDNIYFGFHVQKNVPVYIKFNRYYDLRDLGFERVI